jgi:hypothetical protein
MDSHIKYTHEINDPVKYQCFLWLMSDLVVTMELAKFLK